MSMPSSDDAEDAARLRLHEALRTLRVLEASGWSDDLIDAARRKVEVAKEALKVFPAAAEHPRDGADAEGWNSTAT